MTIDLDAIESAAKAATPGPWNIVRDPDGYTHYIGPSLVTQVRDDADYIAAANPAVVLELVTELRAKNKLLEEIFDDCGDKNGGMCPVCHMYAHKHWCWYPHLAKMLGKPLDGHDERFLALDDAIRTAANNIRAGEEKK